MRTGFAVVAFVFVAGVLIAQPPAPGPPVPSVPPPPPPAPLPTGQVVSNPISVGAESAGLPGGKDVSQPLQPVGPEPTPVPDPKGSTGAKEPAAETKAIPPEHPRGPLGPSWDDMELLYWWPMRQPVPGLAYGTRSGLPPVPGQNGTQLLVGGQALGSQPSAGGRFGLGMAVNEAETIGIEAGYLFLGTRSFDQTARDYGGGSTTTFGLPYTDATTGSNGVLALAQPGVTHSNLLASTSVSVQGWEVNAVGNVFDEKYVKINALFGWRYFDAHEGLRIEQTQFGTGGGSVVRTADQFDTSNRFNGGQLGLHADIHHGVVFCELTGKIAFGQTYEVLREEGETLFQPYGLQGPVTRMYGGSGLYVQPSSAGRSAAGAFALLPEGSCKFGFRLGDAGRLYVGYSFLYLSDAIRPGDQIDRTLHPAQIPLVSGLPPAIGSDRPSRLFNHSDFWTQGLTIGLETRY
jgi:hypothetical protein